MTFEVTEETLIQRSKAPRVTLAAVERNIIAEHYFTAYEGRMGSVVEGTYQTIGREAGNEMDLDNLKLLTFCVLVLENGFTVHGVSACASPENFDPEIGKSIARKNAVDQIWPLMGYELRTKLYHEEHIADGDPLGIAITHLISACLGNEQAVKAIDAQMILSELIPVNIESNEDIARICHEANRSWCELNGDMSQPRWEEAPQWQKDSAIAGVAFHRANPDAGDSASHDEWVRHKLADGWVYGPEKDPEAKTHPCLVPFEELPHAQQFKDRLFRTIVHASLKSPLAPTKNHLRLIK